MGLHKIPSSPDHAVLYFTTKVIVLRSAAIIYWLWIWVWHVGGCGICGVVGKMAKDVGTAIRKSSYCGIVSTLLGCFF